MANLYTSALVPLKGMIWQLLQEAEQFGQICYSETSRPVDLLLTLVTSGIVHVLLFPDEDCSPVLQHIETLLGLLRTSESTAPPYAEVQPLLLMELEQMKNAQKQALEHEGPVSENVEDVEAIGDAELDDSLADDEWIAFLDPFRD